MSYLAVNSMGLFADIIGVWLVFTYGLPANVSRTGAVYIIGRPTKQTSQKQNDMTGEEDVVWSYL